MTMYNGSRNAELKFYPAICFTESEESAQAYGMHVHAVDIDSSLLNVMAVKMTDEEMRAAIDEQRWPCDCQSDIDSAIAAGYDAVAYTDCDERGYAHDCLRILTAEAFARAVDPN